MRFTNVTPTEDQILKNAKKLLGETRVTIAMTGLPPFSANNPPPMVPLHLCLYIQLTSYFLKFSLTLAPISYMTRSGGKQIIPPQLLTLKKLKVTKKRMMKVS